MSDALTELKVKPSMNGLTATVHGEPANMTGLANAVMGLGAVSAVAGVFLLNQLLLYYSGFTEEMLGLIGLLGLIAGSFLALVGVFRRHELRDRLARDYLPLQKSVTVLELTPRRLLINRTSKQPQSIPLSDIHSVRLEDGIVVLEGEQTVRVDASQNSAEATAWLCDELAHIIGSAGNVTRPPEELKRLLGRHTGQTT